MSENYYTDEYDEEEEYDKHALPDIVQEILDQRHAINYPDRSPEDGKVIGVKTPTMPTSVASASQEVVDALKQHIKAGLFRPENDGGYITLLQHLGVTPKSSDPYVKEPDHNLWLISFKDDPSETEKKSNKLYQSHRAEVRFMRYQEFIDRQGHDFSECYFSGENLYDECDIGPIPTLELLMEEEGKGTLDYGIVMKDAVLTEHQCKEIGQAFILGFGSYIDSDRFALGMTPGSKDAGRTKNGHFVNFEISLSILKQQCYDIANMYTSQERPLGHYTNPKSGSSAEAQDPDRERLNNLIHEKKIEQYLTELVMCLQKHISFTMAYAQLMRSMTEMLIRASVQDRSIRRCIVCHDNGRILQSLFQMRRTAVRNAKHAEVDPSRSLETAYHWWVAYNSITGLIGVTSGILGNEIHCPVGQNDVEFAIQAFEKEILPEFLKSFEQKEGVRRWFSEEKAVWKALHSILGQLPKKVATRFVKSHWNLMEVSALRDIEEELKNQNNIQYGDCEGVKVREAHMAPKAIADLVRLVGDLCGYGFEANKSMGGQITPGPLAIRILKKGAVPLLMNCARSKQFPKVMEAATFGLGQISRFKDCRQIMLQQSNDEGIKLVQSLMTSNDISCASSAMLLVLHLAWDEEWFEPLRDMKPGIELLSLKYASFALKTILQKAASMKEEEKRDEAIHMSELLKLYRSSSLKNSSTEDREMQKKRREFKTEERKKMVDNRLGWREIEKVGHRPIEQSTVARCLILLASSFVTTDPIMRKRTYDNTDFLHLAIACIDSPMIDVGNAAVNAIRNYSVASGAPSPSRFPDPDHLLEGIFNQVENGVLSGEPPGQYGIMLMQTAATFYDAPEWRKTYKTLMKKDEQVKWYIDNMIDSGRTGVQSIELSQTLSSRQKFVNAHASAVGIPESCKSISGKLATCFACGKFEGKRGQYKKCSRCSVATYCGRECQQQDWKKHKTACKHLRGKK